MDKLLAIINFAGWLIAPLALWGLIYIWGRIAVHFYIRSKLGDMPSAEEISKLYEENNAIIEYRKHSPIDKNL